MMRLRRAMAVTLVACGISGSTGTIADAGSIPVPGGLIRMPVKSMTELRFKNVVRQTYDVSCGAAAVATLLNFYYGRDVTENAVIEAMLKVGDKEKIRRSGFSMLDMKRYAELEGFVSGGYRIKKVEDLNRLKAPVLTLINSRGYSHFVVLKGVANGKAFIADPAFGNRSVSLPEFADQWSNVVLTVLSAQDNGDSRFTLDATLAAPTNDILHIIDHHLERIISQPGEFG